ncbi:hexokinase [Histoplasma capsulatum G186AR]|uniref:Phosphotransferase n=2 Tax=Ajellomyces capsulatus TaxID=5037 RepID=C0NPF2_AJECG|nr:hexokinase [Histoplasma capsulatum G186AR]EEH06812.1 hexokinase [Histoplasma capsulatum G186AR]KAG5294161.1 hexokinase [Histoplasma capsulatum]QSS75616.1 hexokinase [Histoplasma capsulatum G186AR]
MSQHSAMDDLDHGLDSESYDGNYTDQGMDNGYTGELHHDDTTDRFLRPLMVSDSTLHELACRFRHIYRHLALTSDQQFLPTPVTRLPTGQETGKYLAIDVGGTNLRVAFIELLGESKDSDATNSNSPTSRDTMQRAQRQRVNRTLEKIWPIGEHLKQDKAEDLFLWIGDCIAEVVADSLAPNLANGTPIPAELEMGITFSFPMMQESLSEARLMPMGKGFAITSNLDLGGILLAGYDRHTRRPLEEEGQSAKRRKRFALPKLKIAAITNDTVATLASLAYLVKSLPNSRVAMGIIVGTGCNATIPMSLKDLHESKAKHVSSRHPDAMETIINTEWTINGAAPPLRELNITTKWDTILDEACARPGFQPFEYMTGGRYIGELVRIIFYDYLTNFVGLSKKELPANLIQEYALSTTYLSSSVAQIQSDLELVRYLTETLPPPESSDWSWDLNSARAFRKVAQAVQTRSAGLIAAAVIGLLACKGELKLRDYNDPTPRQHSNFMASSVNNGASPNDIVHAVNSKLAAHSAAAAAKAGSDGHIVPIVESVPSNWQSGPEELVVAYTGGIIQRYPRFKETCQQFIDRLVIWDGPQESGKSVFLREASDGGIIGAGVLAGMLASGNR